MVSEINKTVVTNASFDFRLKSSSAGKNLANTFVPIPIPETGAMMIPGKNVVMLQLIAISLAMKVFYKILAVAAFSLIAEVAASTNSWNSRSSLAKQAEST